MAAYKKYINDTTGNIIYPYTVSSAIYDEDGNKARIPIVKLENINKPTSTFTYTNKFITSVQLVDLSTNEVVYGSVVFNNFGTTINDQVTIKIDYKTGMRIAAIVTYI